MHPRTQATLDDLAARDWFTRVGLKDTEGAIILGSWGEAVASCRSSEWRDLCQEAANQLCERIAGISKARLNLWNTILQEVRPSAVALVVQKTSAIVEQHNLPDSFVTSVRWDIVNLLMEAEYADLVSPAFFASQAYWYKAGHFPCGWDGEFPAGKLIIY